MVSTDFHGQRPNDNSVLASATLNSAIYHHVGDTAAEIIQNIDLTDLSHRTLYLAAETGNWRIRVGDYSSLGADLITNGDFAADSDWTKGTGWSIAAGVASSDGSQSADSDLDQTIEIVEGEMYTVSFAVSNYSAGNVTPVVGGTEGTDRSANGTHTETIKAGSTTTFSIRADADFVGDVDDVTVKRAIMTHTVTPVTDTTGGGQYLLSEGDQIGITCPADITVVGVNASAILTYWVA